jgi:uncharacterized surface protein with fasciclin (FAS1) repeats
MKKKHLSNLMGAVLFAFGSSLAVACGDDDPVPQPASNTITDIVVKNPAFSTLKTAVTRTNLGGTLSGTGPFTVFAPDNDAFTKSGLTAAANTLDTATLKKILLYHTLGAKVPASAISGTNNKTVMVNGDSVFITKNAGGVFVNGVKVKTADVGADNGVIHVLDRVLLPPGGNLVQTAQADTIFSYLVAAVVRASTGSTNVAAVLSGNGPYTLFAPTNQAFREAGFLTIGDIQVADPNVLASILTVHVVSGRAFSCDLSNGQTVNTLSAGKTIKVNINGSGVFVKVNPASAEAQVTGTDVMARNGVVHVINKVLLP